VRKAPVTSATLAVALFVLLLPSHSEARPRHGKGFSKRAAAVGRSTPARARARRNTARRNAGGPASRESKTVPTGHDAALTHHPDSGEVMLDSIEVVTADGGVLPGPTTPPVPYNYPQPPCPAVDPPVIEAHIHVAGTEILEREDREVLAPRHDSSRISKIARRLGSLFRPKSATARVRPKDVDLSELLAENFLIPVSGVDRDRLRDSFLESRGQYARHLAIDIGAPRGTPILATDDGEVVRLSRERRGGITIYQKDSSGRYLFFYCHLSRYADGLSVGQKVSKGDIIGYVGATGHVIGGPHLHFSITRLPEDDDNLREGLAINPYLLFLAGVP
jgi:peptidoglycan LD-endopeptidase LytH